jgi:undecaprenyl-phosphate 4-deoxy-4-formamido-L-arabinose transferase
MDDDLQHPPEAIPDLIRALTDEFDLVYGVAKVEEHGFWRNLASRAVKRAMVITLGVEHARKISAFRAFRNELKSPFMEVRDAFVSIDVILSWVTTRITSIEVEMERRAESESNYNVRSLFGHALNMVTGYSITPLKLVTMLGLATALLGFGLLVIVLVLFFTGRTEVAGFTTIASMVALFAGAQMAAIGILGEYLGRLHFRSMNRPTYVIRDEVK